MTYSPAQPGGYPGGPQPGGQMPPPGDITFQFSPPSYTPPLVPSRRPRPKGALVKVIAGAALAVVTGLLIANHFIPGGFQFATYRKLGSENAVSMDLTVEERIELMKRIQRLAPDEVESKWGDKHLARGTRQGGPPNDCGWQSWVS